MLDGENINHAVRIGSMDDTGTRMSFLLELYELWETGLDILERYDQSSPFYEEKKKELEHALKLLAYHMEKDYQDKAVKDVIDSLPKHGEDIKD